MNRIEPYIGMPIILGDHSGHEDHCCDMNPPQRPQPPQEPMPPQEPEMPQPPQEPMPPQEPAPSPCPPCLCDENCSCQPQPPQQTMRVGMAYVPWQRWQNPYEYEEGLKAGTIFPDLNLPFLGAQGGMRR